MVEYYLVVLLCLICDVFLLSIVFIIFVIIYCFGGWKVVIVVFVMDFNLFFWLNW